MAAADREPKTPKAGEPFSPHRLFLCALVPESLLAYKGLQAEDKLVLARLYMYAGRKDHCFVGVDSLAAKFGVTADSMSRTLQRLAKQGFIRRERKARAVAVTRLLFHPALTYSLRSDDPTQTPDYGQGDDPTCVPDHTDAVIRRGRRDDPASLGGSDPTQTPDAYKEEVAFSEVVQEENHSSSSSTAVTVERKTRTDQSLSNENLEALRSSWAAAYFGADFSQKPTRKQTTRAIARFERGAEEMAVYLEHFPSRKLKPKSYEYLFTDVADFWPDIKGDLEKEVAQENARVEAMESARRVSEDAQEKRRALHWACRNKGWKPIYSLDCARCAGFGRIPSTEEVCTCAAGIEFTRLANLCPKCGESGYLIVGAWSKARWEWCDCQHAQKRRERNPDYMETLNAQLREAQAKIDRANGRAATA